METLVAIIIVAGLVFVGYRIYKRKEDDDAGGGTTPPVVGVPVQGEVTLAEETVTVPANGQVSVNYSAVFSGVTGAHPVVRIYRNNNLLDSEQIPTGFYSNSINDAPSAGSYSYRFTAEAPGPARVRAQNSNVSVSIN